MTLLSVYAAVDAAISPAPGASFANVPLGRSGETVAFSDAAQVSPKIYYLGRWLGASTERDTRWVPEEPVDAWIDIRSTGRAALPPTDGATNCCLIAVTQTPVENVEWVQLSTTINGPLGVSTGIINTLLGLAPGTLTADTFGELAFELMVEDRRPGEGRKPLDLNRNLVWTMKLDGDRLFNVAKEESPAAWENLRQRIENDYDRIRAASVQRGDDLHLRWLAVQEAKYRESYTEFIGDNPDEGTREPSTTVLDDFNRADEELNAGSWQELSGDWEVVSNEATLVSAGGDGRSSANHTTDLSGDDHYSQADITYNDGFSGQEDGLAVRYANHANLYMCAQRDEGTNKLKILKRVSGTISELATLDFSANAGDTHYCEIDGSDLDYQINSSSELTSSDTDITGNTLVGFWSNRSGSFATWDNFEGSDLGGGPVTARRVIIID